MVRKSFQLELVIEIDSFEKVLSHHKKALKIIEKVSLKKIKTISLVDRVISFKDVISKIIAPRLKRWNLRSGISSPKPTGCCLGDLEAHLKIALLSQIGQSTVIF